MIWEVFSYIFKFVLTPTMSTNGAMDVLVSAPTSALNVYSITSKAEVDNVIYIDQLVIGKFIAFQTSTLKEVDYYVESSKLTGS